MLVNLEGECTVARAQEIKERLLEVLDNGQPLELDLRAVTKIDLSFCQIIHALRATCQARGLACPTQEPVPSAVEAPAKLCALTWPHQGSGS